MIYRFLADALVVIHFGFILFVIFGALGALRYRWWPWLHLPVVAWGISIEWIGWICPLAPLENRFRALAGQGGYEGGFIEHYLIPLIYPDGLTRGVQWTLGALVLAINLGLYAWVARRRKGPKFRLPSR